MSALTSEQIEFFFRMAISRLANFSRTNTLRYCAGSTTANLKPRGRITAFAISPLAIPTISVKKMTRPHRCCKLCKCVSAICTIGNLSTMIPYSILPRRSLVQIFNSSTIRRSSSPHITGMRFFGIKTMGTGNVCQPISSHAGSLWTMPMSKTGLCTLFPALIFVHSPMSVHLKPMRCLILKIRWRYPKPKLSNCPPVVLCFTIAKPCITHRPITRTASVAPLPSTL